MQVPPSIPSTAGFSRPDLLASTLGIALLASLALPLRAGGSKAAQTAFCADNFQRLGRALALYTLDQSWFPPNPDDGNTIPGYAWIPGQAGPGGSQEFNPDILQDPARSLLIPYLEAQTRVFACPADERAGTYQGADPARRGEIVQAARSVAMNIAVGLNPTAAGHRPTDGAWLDNNHTHTYGQKWRTYGRPDHIVEPGPSGLYIFIDEDARSINDGILAHGMQTEEWIDWPGTRHDLGANLSFADGHVEFHHWVDPRTVVNTSVARLRVPGSVDWRWLTDRTSAAIPR